MNKTMKRKTVMQMGGMTSMMRPQQANAGASVAPSQKSTTGMKYGGMTAKKKTKMAKGGSMFKTCASCPSPSKCTAAGKCLKKS